jgi:hypothetical protein
MDAGTLHAALLPVCPVISVSIGKPDDRTTWTYEAGPDALPEQKTAADNLIATIPVDYQPPPEPLPEDVALYNHENRIRSLEGAPPMSLVDFVEKKARAFK